MRWGFLRDSIICGPLRRALFFRRNKMSEQPEMIQEMEEMIDVAKAPNKKSKLKVMLEHRSALQVLPSILGPQEKINALLGKVCGMLDEISVEALTIEQNLKGSGVANEYGPSTAQNWNVFQEKLSLLSSNKPTITENEMMLKIMKIK